MEDVEHMVEIITSAVKIGRKRDAVLYLKGCLDRARISGQLLAYDDIKKRVKGG